MTYKKMNFEMWSALAAILSRPEGLQYAYNLHQLFVNADPNIDVISGRLSSISQLLHFSHASSGRRHKRSRDYVEQRATVINCDIVPSRSIRLTGQLTLTADKLSNC